MAAHPFQLVALIQELGDDCFLAEALYFPEVSCLGDDVAALVAALEHNARALLARDEQAQLHQRRGPVEVATDALRLELPPPPRSQAWRHPVEITLPIVRWAQGDDAVVAAVPALGIEVVAHTADELDHWLPRHAHVALRRERHNSLDRLAWLARGRRLEVRAIPFTLDRATPRAAALAEREAQKRKESVLPQVGTNLREAPLGHAYEVEQPLALVAESLTGRAPRSVLLIGPSGVGKTALVHELVHQSIRLGVGHRPFWATSGARLVAGMSGFGMWQQRCQDVLREASARQAVVHLGNLMELLEVGKSEHQSQGLASSLRPWLARGELLAIAEATPEQLPLIERQDPQLLRAFVPVRLEEPTGARLEAILAQFAKRQWRSTLLPDGLAEVLRLHRRYAAYSANPGRPVRFLRDLLADHPHHVPIEAKHVTAAFARETGLPRVLLEDSERLHLDRTRTWFSARVIGQGEAVDLVVDLLATVKAALNRPRKPLASLLFIGPTGVGKTEMAKALAEFLFSSRERLTRFDMSEYGDAAAVQRLIGGAGCAEGVLTAKVREQPFSVVLLDEVEKAHPLLFDLLLQVLGEGRLTDGAGRLADFCNSVVIMTSNLGAETYQQGAFGLAPAGNETKRAREHFLDAVERAVRPELFNRIDRVVPFSPLDQETIWLIADRQLELLRARDGVRYRGVALEASDEVPVWLAKKGHDPRYGARPLKRALERELLVPLAARMNAYTAETPLRVELALDGDAPRVTVRARGVAAGLAPAAAELAGGCVELRREAQGLSACGDVQALANEAYRLRRFLKRPEHDPELAALERLLGEVRELLSAAAAREDEALFALYARPGQAAELGHLAAPLDEGRAALRRLLLRLYLRRFESAGAVSLVAFSEDGEAHLEMARGYARVARDAGASVAVWLLSPPPAAARGERLGPVRRVVLRAGDVLDGGLAEVQVRTWDEARKAYHAEPEMLALGKGVIGTGLELAGEAAYPRFAFEEGLHHFIAVKRSSKVLVVTGPEQMKHLPLPEGIERRGAIGGQRRRRTYRLEQRLVDDAVLGELRQTAGELGPVLAECVRGHLDRAARGVLET